MNWFVISDVHSFYRSMINALEETGFIQNDKDHTLIVAGDIFDRGDQSQEIRDYLTKTNNKICIIGNHELLLLKAINRGYFKTHDLGNGTIDAAIQLAGGFASYPELEDCDKARQFFIEEGFDELSDYVLQERIIKNLIDTNIVEWLVDNFYVEDYDGKKEIEWNEDRTNFSILARPRYYVQIEDRLIFHGFFPSPDWIRSIPTKGKTLRGLLPDQFDLLDDSSQDMWEEYGCGVWSNTPYWLKQFHKFKLEKLNAYIVKRGIKHIYMGHWTKSEIDNMVISLSLSPTYEKYHDKTPKLYFTDDVVVKSGNVIVETFTT